MEKQSENSVQVLDYTKQLTIQHFEALKTQAQEVQVENKYYNISELLKKDASDDIIVTDFISNGFVKDRESGEVCDCIEFYSAIKGEPQKYIYSGSKLVRLVADLRRKLNLENNASMSIPLRITYKGKVKSASGFSFDDFTVVGLSVNN
jgi:hypothetical protein